MPLLSYIHQLFSAEQCQAYIHTLRWKDRPLQCPRCQSRDVDPWGTYYYRPGCQRYRCRGCKRTFNDLTEAIPYCTGASARCRTGFLRPSCCACRVHPGASRENWVSMAAPAIGGAGGCAMPPCPMRCIASWKAPWKPMTSIILRDTRGKRRTVGRRRWDAAHVGAARNASPVGAMMTKTGLR